MKKIALIVLNYKQPKLTVDTINSLLKIKTDHFSYHIFIIDNNSQDTSIDTFEKQFSKNDKVKIYNTGANYGYAGGNNFGFRLTYKLGYDYFLVINNDVIVDPNFLIHLFKTAQKEKMVGLVGPKIYFAPGYEFHKDRYSNNEIGNVIWSAGGLMDWQNIYGSNRGVDEVDKGQYNKVTDDSDFLTGCCFLLPREIIGKIGIFDERYFMYLEDVELCQRIKRAGYKLIYQPKSFIWHVNSGSSGSGSNLHDYFITRNRYLFGFKYASFRTKFALIRECCRLLIFGRKFQRKGAKDYIFKKFNKGSWR